VWQSLSNGTPIASFVVRLAVDFKITHITEKVKADQTVLVYKIVVTFDSAGQIL